MGVTIVLDARVLIAFSRRDHEHHHRALSILARPNAELVVNPVTMAEYLIKPAQRGRDVEADMNRLCRQAAIRVVEEPELTGTAPWPVSLARTRVETGLKMPDTIVLATAELLDGRVATFGEALREAARARGHLFDDLTHETAG
ncbi:MAG: type II toxin-antitoxin system VapC family toxin [Actinomycetia bacterium]|nr:type II toxin-antitoxin system VapC family toxin [Actinomycetes bacterium]